MDGQEQFDESGLPGPGAPTPLSALDVSERFVLSLHAVRLQC
jgi:hypothetical protein